MLFGVEQIAAVGRFGARAGGERGGLISDLNAVWKGESVCRIHSGRGVCQWPLPG